MSRTVDQIIREQLGALMVEVAVLTARLEALGDENVKLKQEVEKLNLSGSRTPEKE